MRVCECVLCVFELTPTALECRVGVLIDVGWRSICVWSPMSSDAYNELFICGLTARNTHLTIQLSIPTVDHITKAYIPPIVRLFERSRPYAETISMSACDDNSTSIIPHWSCRRSFMRMCPSLSLCVQAWITYGQIGQNPQRRKRTQKKNCGAVFVVVVVIRIRHKSYVNGILFCIVFFLLCILPSFLFASMCYTMYGREWMRICAVCLLCSDLRWCSSVCGWLKNKPKSFPMGLYNSRDDLDRVVTRRERSSYDSMIFMNRAHRSES